MAGVLEGVEVLDLSWGIPGPVTGMLLADHGARVTKIEPPGGDPTRSFSGARVWHRGKRSAFLDLKNAEDRDRLLALARTADIILESYSPGVTTRLGIDYDTLHAINPRLVYTSITAYGLDNKHSDRPGYEALVAARTGQQWESRGVEGGTIARLSGFEGALPGLPVPDDCWTAAKRPGPLFAGTPWASMATAYLATLATSAALRVREQTGRGQHVETSLLQGVLATTVGGWQKAEHADAPNFQSWVIDPRAPKGVFKCKDGRWIHHWTPLPAFVIGVSEGDHLEITDEVTSPRDAPMRIGLAPEEMVLLHHYNPIMAERFAKFPSDEWIAIAAKVGTPVQPIRSPEEALLDELLVTDGCVVEVDDPELGPVRQVGRVFQFHGVPNDPPAPPVAPGANTDDVKAEADAAADAPVASASTAAAPKSPLEGIRVLDLGLAVAGPWGTMMLGDLGADVIKVNTMYDGYWMSNHIGMACNRGKRSISINLKDPNGMDILRRLVETADVVQHNMRYDAAVRLGVDYESLKKIKPDLIYCHTRGLREERARAAARQRPDRRRARGPRLARRRARPRRHTAVAGHLARRHRQRLPLRDRDRAGAVPPRPHRRGPVRRHVDHLRAAAQRVDRMDHARRQAQGRPSRSRPDAARLERAVPALPVRRRDVAVRHRDRGVALAVAVLGHRARRPRDRRALRDRGRAQGQRRRSRRRARSGVRGEDGHRVVRHPRRGRRAGGGVDARLRARPLQRPRDPEAWVGRRVPAPHGREDEPVRADVRHVGDTGHRSRARRSRRA